MWESVIMLDCFDPHMSYNGDRAPVFLLTVFLNGYFSVDGTLIIPGLGLTRTICSKHPQQFPGYDKRNVLVWTYDLWPWLFATISRMLMFSHGSRRRGRFWTLAPTCAHLRGSCWTSACAASPSPSSPWGWSSASCCCCSCCFWPTPGNTRKHYQARMLKKQQEHLLWETSGVIDVTRLLFSPPRSTAWGDRSSGCHLACGAQHSDCWESTAAPPPLESPTAEDQDHHHHPSSSSWYYLGLPLHGTHNQKNYWTADMHVNTLMWTDWSETPWQSDWNLGFPCMRHTAPCWRHDPRAKKYK